MQDFLLYFKIGLHHVLDWKAYDHILFLIVLTVVYSFKDWKKILWLITLFTIGHTLTLALSAYHVIFVNFNIVEFLIALTIFVTALVNVFTAGKTSKEVKTNINLFFAFFFGLIHGLGFSSYFNLIVGKGHSKLLPLLEFALGIEGAQVIIVLIILLIGFLIQTVFRFSKRDWIMVTSSIVMGVVIPMLIHRKFW